MKSCEMEAGKVRRGLPNGICHLIGQGFGVPSLIAETFVVLAIPDRAGVAMPCHAFKSYPERRNTTI